MDLPDAVIRLRDQVHAAPGDAQRHARLAEHLASLGRHAEARDALREAVVMLPAVAGLWWRLAVAESSIGDGTAALACLTRALEAGPQGAEDWRRIGWTYLEYWRYAEAQAALENAATLDPGNPGIETLLANVRQQSGDTEGALQSLARASARAPGDLALEVEARLMLPQVCASIEDAARWRDRHAEGLDQLHARLPQWHSQASRVFELGHENFLLAYQGEDDLVPQRRYSSFIASLAGTARPEWREPLRATFDGARRLRVGFAASIFRDCTAGRYFERWITGLDPQRFERFVYHCAPVSDAFTQRIAAASEHFLAVRAPNEELAARIRGDRLDVIVYPEVGMTPVSYLLAALRLAPVQAAGWGHPVTTGSDAIDHYFTAAAMEPPGAEAHYQERLERLPGLGVEYAMPEIEPAFSRADLGLPASGSFYLCPQSLFKIHPSMDAIFADVLAADPGGMLVFFQAMARGVTERFGRRIQDALAARGLPPRGQVKFLPRLPAAVFRRAVAAADVVLDPLRWSGGNTSLDTFAAGTPLVAMEGRFMRARQTAAMLRIMNLEEMLAPSTEGYVSLAVSIARDRERNAHLRRAIAERRGELFDRPECTEAFAEGLLRMARGD
ncbi:MAG TPA: tetratricopeptide repeat protein [Usitatibacter sp.]|nr:tetratricopeptide repeat protein [Usitatibacter sp.]